MTAAVHSGCSLDQDAKRDGVWAIVRRVVVEDDTRYRTISDEPDGYPVARNIGDDLLHGMPSGIRSGATNS